jgi:hypothetical protein
MQIFVDFMGWAIVVVGAAVMIFMAMYAWHCRNEPRAVNLLQEFARIKAEEEEIKEEQRRLEAAHLVAPGVKPIEDCTSLNNKPK